MNISQYRLLGSRMYNIIYAVLDGILDELFLSIIGSYIIELNGEDNIIFISELNLELIDIRPFRRLQSQDHGL